MDVKNDTFVNRIRRTGRWVWYAVGAVLLANWVALAGEMIFYPQTVQTAAVRYEAMREEIAKAAPPVEERIKPLQEKNPFFPNPPRPGPPQCTQILGDAAFFRDRWVKVGEEINGAKVVAIDSTSVTILWEEKEIKQYPFQAQGADSGPRNSRSGRRRERPEVPSTATPTAGTSPQRPQGLGDFGGRPPWMLSPEERDQMRQRFMNMTPEEREALRNEMRRRFQEGGFGGRGGRGGRGRPEE